MVVFGIVVVVGGIAVAVVAATTGRRAGKKGHLFTLWPTIPQRKHAPFSLLSAMMAGETHFALRPTIFVDELVTVGSQSISLFVMESTVVELPIALTTVVVVAVATGRCARRKVHLSTLWPTIPQRKHAPFSLLFTMMAGETHFALRPTIFVGFFAVLVAELVTLVNSR